jgi:hypothetical protein
MTITTNAPGLKSYRKSLTQMNYTVKSIKSLFSNKSYVQAIMILPALGILAVTGCSSIQGTADQQQTTHRVATYMEQSQENAQAADSDPDPGYEWFY